MNDRTSHQIRQATDRLLPPAIRDVDNREGERKGTISMFDGPAPEVAICADAGAERDRVAAFLRTAIDAGIAPAEIGVLVRARGEIARAYAAVETAGLAFADFTDRSTEMSGRVGVGVMHFAKGLEFKAVAVMACDADVLPLKARVDAVIDEADLEEVFEAERQLLYVACTRARDRLIVTATRPPRIISRTSDERAHKDGVGRRAGAARAPHRPGSPGHVGRATDARTARPRRAT